MPVMITLQKIKDQRPCKEGWDLVLASRGEKPDFYAEFPLADIIKSNNLGHAIWALRCVDATYGKRFALECAKLVKHLMKGQRSLDALEVTERFLAGQATQEEIAAACAAAYAAARAAYAAADAAAYAAADAAAYAAADAAAYAAADAAAYAARREILQKQEEILRSILA